LGHLKKTLWGWAFVKSSNKWKKIDLKNWVKIVILEKWLTMPLNLKHCGHPPMAQPNLNANLTLLKSHEPLFHTYHKLLRQTDED
jgi:hypothetical protein